MSKRFPILAAALLASSILVGGCASTKITVTPAVKMAVVPAARHDAYTLGSVAIAFPVYIPPDWRNDGFARQFVQLAEARYPALFNKSVGAVPIDVQVNVNQDSHQAAAFGVYLCTLCLIGGIFPSVPWETEWQIQVQSRYPGGDSPPFTSSGLMVKNRGWWSILTPLGLITIPGESDAPKVSAVGAASPGQIPPAHRAYAIQCMVDLLAAELLKGGALPPPPAAPTSPGIPQPGSSTPDSDPLF